jgi:PadR family transcriptional regulator PadR
MRQRKISAETVRVLEALARQPDRARYGYELGDEVGLRSGSLYPILIRLSERGLVEASWETPEPGRPPRHLYRLTGEGRRMARSLSAQRIEENRGLRAARITV